MSLKPTPTTQNAVIEDLVRRVQALEALPLANFEHVVFFDKDLQEDTFLYVAATGQVSIGDPVGIHYVADFGMKFEAGAGSDFSALSLVNGVFFGEAQQFDFNIDGSSFNVNDAGDLHSILQVDGDSTLHFFSFIAGVWTEVFRIDPDGSIHGLASVGSITWDLT